MKRGSETTAEDIVGLAGLGLIVAGIVLLVFAGMPDHGSAWCFSGHPEIPFKLHTQSND